MDPYIYDDVEDADDGSYMYDDTDGVLEDDDDHSDGDNEHRK